MNKYIILIISFWLFFISGLWYLTTFYCSYSILTIKQCSFLSSKEYSVNTTIDSFYWLNSKTEFNSIINKNPILKSYFLSLYSIPDNNKLVLEMLDQNLLYFANKDMQWNYWLYDFSYYYYLDSDTTEYFIEKPEELNNYYFMYLKNWNTFKNQVIFVDKSLVKKYKITIPWLNVLAKYIATDFQYDKEDLNKRIETFKEINTTTQKIIAWKQTQDEKISAIYNWINQNINYDDSLLQNILNKNTFKIKIQDITDKDKSHSWIDTFETKKGVCDWIAKLFTYMIAFAWIKNYEVITWIDLNSIVFHAWVRIWDKYFDPTYDLSNKDTLLKYYNLPKDLFYADRLSFNNLTSTDIQNYTSLPLQERKNKIADTYFGLVDKYKSSNYYILADFTFLKSKGVLKYDDFTIDDIKKVVKNVQELNSMKDIYNYIQNSDIVYLEINPNNLLYYIQYLDIQNKILYHDNEKGIYFILKW